MLEVVTAKTLPLGKTQRESHMVSVGHFGSKAPGHPST